MQTVAAALSAKQFWLLMVFIESSTGLNWRWWLALWLSQGVGFFFAMAVGGHDHTLPRPNHPITS
jgi:hypothetical protein